jgi:hypothetical protein
MRSFRWFTLLFMYVYMSMSISNYFLKYIGSGREILFSCSNKLKFNIFNFQKNKRNDNFDTVFDGGSWQ